MSDVQMPAWLSKLVEEAMRLDGNDETWATPTHVIGAEAVEANGDVCSDYASDLVGLLVDELERLRAALDVVEDCDECHCDPDYKYTCEVCELKRAVEAARAAAGGEG